MKHSDLTRADKGIDVVYSSATTKRHSGLNKLSEKIEGYWINEREGT